MHVKTSMVAALGCLFSTLLLALVGCAGSPEQGKAPATTANPVAVMVTDIGEVEIELFEDAAPNSVKNFVSLCDKKFYDGLTFHRYEPKFVVQGGDPRGDGEGGPGYALKFEPGATHVLGAIGMAREIAPDTAGSQFYFVLDVARCAQLDGRYCVFGRVTKGFENVMKLRKGNKILSAKVTARRDHDYVPVTIPDPSAAPNGR